jgi:hypothetical protein
MLYDPVRMTRKLVFVTALAALALGCSKPAPTPAPAAPPPATAAAAPTPTPPPPEGQDFAEEVRLLYRVVACQGDGALPPPLDAAVVKDHCAAMERLMGRYRKTYVDEAESFIAKLRPAGLPKTVVYPFGGGDLISALTTYPDATEITTLSLEQAGDPRRIRSLDKKRLSESLGLIRKTIAPLLAMNDSTSENLMKGQRGDIPGQVAFFVVALAVHGYEPVSLRYFHVQPDGGLHYLSAEEIAAEEKAGPKRLKATWTPPDFSPAFADMEMGFRPQGVQGAPPRIHRHIGANLADSALRKDPGLLRYLESRGRISAMTKAASYLLWRDDFKVMRNYLLDHMEFMVSDSTGIPPGLAVPAGFVLEPYGRFSGSFLGANAAYNEEFRRLFGSQTFRPLPFRYGYLDAGKRYHMIVTRKLETKAARATAVP